MNKKVTIQDIADALGISRNTVSKAINNAEGLADATRERILQKAVEMGYKQFSYVEALAGNGFQAAAGSQQPEYRGEIALLTGSFLTYSHFASLMLDKFQREISQLGYTLNTHRVTGQEIRSRTLPPTLHLEQVRGIVCIELFDWDYDEMLCDLDIPILFVDGPAKRCGRSLKADQLYMDNTSEITRFVGDMLARGLDEIGFVGDYDHCQSFYERYAAFYLAMEMAGHPVQPQFNLKYNDPKEIHGFVAGLQQLPDVWICANDFVARDLMLALDAAGKQVPTDVRICGFDDSAESRFCNPPLTTVHIHTQIMAFSAVHLLISRIKEPSLDYRTIHTETDLIYRSSTGEL